MSLVRRIARDKRIALTVVGAVLLGDLLLYGLAVYPLRTAAVRAGARAAAAAESLPAGEADLGAARARLAAQTRVGDQLREFYDTVLPRDLAEARSMTYPRLASLADRLGLVLERRTSAGERADGGGLGRLRTNMLLAGNYADIRRFIEALETAPEFLVIEEVVLGQREEASDAGLVLTLGLSTYYRVESGA